MYLRLLVSLLLLAATVNCATSRGFVRNELRNEMGLPTVDDKDIERALKLKPQLPKPFKVGIYFKENDNARDYRAREKWRWTEEDRQKIYTLGEDLKKNGEISDFFVITQDLARSDDLKSIRYAAAQHGADAVLVISGVNDVDAYNNTWSWTYIGPVTALVVPANHVDVLFLSRAAMWDVRNQFLYMTAESESIKKQMVPAAWTNEKRLLEEAKVDSVSKLREEVSKMIKDMRPKKAVAKN